MRYAVISKGLTISQLQNEVKRCGGRNLKVAVASKQVFCDLEPTAIDKLKATGCIVSKVGGVKATIMPPIVAPPTPVAGIPTYTPQALFQLMGFEDLRALMTPSLYGAGVNIAVIGTGIRETHEEIAGHIIYSKNYTTSPMRDGFDHDTGVCSIVLAIAPECRVLNMKVLDDKGSGSEEDVAIAIDDCISLHENQPNIAPSVINLSLGGPDEANPSNPLRVACRAAIEKGIWIDASAGNGGPDPITITCPACERYVFAVGAAGVEPFQISSFSSRGPTKEGLIKPDFVGPGENIIMASSESDTATTAKSGTSFATPLSSGATALLQEAMVRYGGVAYAGEEPLGVSITEILGPISIQETMDRYLPQIGVKPEGSPLGKDNSYGHGLPFGPMVLRTMGVIPIIDITSILAPLLILGMMGMIMAPMVKGVK